MKKKGLYRKLSMSELKNIFGGEMLDDQGRKIVRKNLDGVYSIKGGVVIEIGYAKGSKTGYGNYILVKDQKNGVIVRYAHLDKINVKKGQMVNKEDEIGIMGNSGTDKKHLHVSVYKDSNRDNPMKYEASDLTMDKGREVNPLEYIRDKGVWPTNTRISGGFNEPYDFSLINSWYTHEGVDFSGRTNPKDPHNRLITDYQCGLKGDGSYNSYKDHKYSYELYIRTRDHQNKTMNILREEWINLGGKKNLKKTLEGVDEKIKGIENNITKGKNKLSEIEDSITKTEDILVPSFIKKKILTNLQKELNKAKKELDDLEDLLRSEKKEKEDFKTLAGQMERAGSVEFAKKIDKLNDAKAYRDKLKGEFEKAVKENEEVQKNSAFSNDYKAKYADYVNNIKAALEKAETNTNIIESNLTKYIIGKKEEELLLVSEPKKPDLAGSTNTATGQTSQTSSSTTTTDTNTGNNNSDSSSEKDTDPEPWLSNPKPTKKNDKKNDGGNNPPPPKNNPPPKKGGGGGGSKPEPPSPPGGGGGSRTIYTPSSIDTNNEYYLGSLYGTKPFSAQESSAFNSTIISNELSALQPITSLNVAGFPVNDTAIKEEPFGV